ncbi:MAG: phosphoglycerate dehydrogenase [Lentisphaeraceae bacterium]|nr:phosphoglycerate dehydrogenase [Lentisphaeraceae bacterium]
MKKRVLIGPSSFGQLDSKPLDLLEEAGLEIVPNPFSRRYTKDEIIDLLNGIDGLIAGLEPLDREVLEKAPGLQALSRCGSGMNNVDQEAATELGVKVSSTPDGPTQSVAEMTLGALLSALRMIPQMSASLHSGNWDKRIGGLLSGRTVAIIGFGRIGERFASLLRPFQAKIVVVDPYRETFPEWVEQLSMEEALITADVISLHVSGNDMILGEAQFAQCKQGLVLLNAARGGNIEENALCAALDEGKIISAWIDSLPREPYTGPLTDYEQVILTPHTSSYTLEGRLKMEVDCAKNLIRDLA